VPLLPAVPLPPMKPKPTTNRPDFALSISFARGVSHNTHQSVSLLLYLASALFDFCFFSHPSSHATKNNTADGKYCVTGGYDRTVRLWNPARLDPAFPPPPLPSHSVRGGGNAGTVPLHLLPRALPIQTYKDGYAHPISAVAVDGASTVLLAASDKTLVVVRTVLFLFCFRNTKMKKVLARWTYIVPFFALPCIDAYVLTATLNAKRATSLRVRRRVDSTVISAKSTRWRLPAGKAERPKSFYRLRTTPPCAFGTREAGAAIRYKC